MFWIGLLLGLSLGFGLLLLWAAIAGPYRKQQAKVDDAYLDRLDTKNELLLRIAIALEQANGQA